MTNSTKKAKRPGKVSAEPDKVLKILAEARQVVDDLGGKTAAAAPPHKKKPAAQEKESPRSRSTPGTARKPASRKKPAATAKATSPQKPAPAPAKAKKTAKATPKRATAPPSPPLLSPRECGIQVAHSLPGRIRFRIKSLQFDYELAREMETRLAAIPGIAEAGASPATGSLLIYYHSKELVAVPLGKAMKTWFPRLDTDSLLAEMLD
jgi:hypothetical protein